MKVVLLQDLHEELLGPDCSQRRINLDIADAQRLNWMRKSGKVAEVQRNDDRARAWYETTLALGFGALLIV